MFSNSSGFNPLNKASRITCYNCHRRHVFGHNTSCSDNRTVTDAYSRKNGGIDSNPCLIFYDYRTTIGCTAVFRIRVMIDCYQIDFRTDEYIVTDCNTATTEKSATLLNETPFANSDRFAIVYIERRQYCCALFERFAKNLLHILAYFFGSAITRIHFSRSLDSCENIANQSLITRFIGRNHFT